MRRESRSPGDESLIGKILVENIPRRPVMHNDIMAWLKKYGDISEIVIYKDCYVVQFDSDIEAAGAVQCENGAQFFGSVVSVKHAEPGILSALRRSGPPVDRYNNSSGPGSGPTRRGPSSFTARDRDRERDRERDRDYERDRERDRDRDRDRDRFRDRDRGRTRERDLSPRGRYRAPEEESNSSYDRRRRHEDRSPRRRSRSPISSRGDRRHVHPLNWLSEVAGGDTLGKPLNGPTTVSVDPLKATGDILPAGNRIAAPQSPPPYTVAIVAVQHDLVPYAETIEKRVSTGIRVPGCEVSMPLKTHIVVLLSADHLTPCLADLTRDRVPFAIICTTTNWSHGSCTLRILYVPTQQEHRNMPLDDALILLQKEYETYVALEKNPPANIQPVVDSTTPTATAPVVDDHTFLAPSRNMVTLLRMLADSRILSIGELDEIASFVQERKRRLEGRRLEGGSGTADTRNGSTTDLKSRILNMLYPQNQANSTATQQPSIDQSSRIGQPTQLDAASLQAVNRLTGTLPNPTIQHAIDTLMLVPPGRFAQPPVSAQQQSGPHSVMPVPPPQQQTQQPSYGRGTSAAAPVMGVNRMSYGGQNTGAMRSTNFSNRIEINTTGQIPDDRARFGMGSQKSNEYQGQGAQSQSRYSNYKQQPQQQHQPQQQQQQQPPQQQQQQQQSYGETHSKASQQSSHGGPSGNSSSYKRDMEDFRSSGRGSGPSPGRGQASGRQKEDQYSGSGGTGDSGEHYPASGSSSWSRRKKGKRGGGGGSKASGDPSSRSSYGGSGNKQVNDLMATSVAPVGAVADSYHYNSTMSGFGSSASYPQQQSSGSYPYFNQPYGYSYPSQQFY